MAAIYDNAASAVAISATSVTTGSFVVGSGPNRAAAIHLVAVSLPGSFTCSLAGVSGVSVAGTPVSGNAGHTAIYGVTAPPSGSQTATASWTGAQDVSIGVITATSVDQTTPLNNGANIATGSQATGSLLITSNAGDLTTSCVYMFNGAAPSTNQTLRWSQTLGNGIQPSGDTGPGTASPTHTWSGATTFFTISGANFNQAASVDAVTAFLPRFGWAPNRNPFKRRRRLRTSPEGVIPNDVIPFTSSLMLLGVGR